MLNSPEEYLSGLNFDPPEPDAGAKSLSAGEHAFVEKYLGFDTEQEQPAPVPMLLPAPGPAPRPEPVFAPEIVVAAPRIEIHAPVKPQTPEIIVAQPAPEQTHAPVQLLEQLQETEQVQQDQQDQQAWAEPVALATETAQAQTVSAPAAQAEELAEAAAPVKVTSAIATAAAVKTAELADAAERASEETIAAKVEARAATAPAQPEEVSLREKMRQADEIQVVSFYISGQIFLLPVAGIQEVLRHMELVKVPQAPAFIAGAINLRGTVMPLVHLSALLTTDATGEYNEKSFIIVTGTPSFQMGLIIDKVNSMHMIPQSRIIWNAEAKLGEAAEFLSALVDLDDKVCGMISPEIITQRILSEF
ncbi:MAG: hypothetical protein HDQ44_04840 [Desulfovibrio sp.]|nr:hypothetical protein [Desulfovibrio sp.]